MNVYGIIKKSLGWCHMLGIPGTQEAKARGSPYKPVWKVKNKNVSGYSSVVL